MESNACSPQGPHYWDPKISSRISAASSTWVNSLEGCLKHFSSISFWRSEKEMKSEENWGFKPKVWAGLWMIPISARIISPIAWILGWVEMAASILAWISASIWVIDYFCWISWWARKKGEPSFFKDKPRELEMDTHESSQISLFTSAISVQIFWIFSSTSCSRFFCLSMCSNSKSEREMLVEMLLPLSNLAR